MTQKLIREIRIDWEKIGPDSYLRNIAAISSIGRIGFTKPVTFFAGENGSGKSTLLEAIAVAYGFNPEGGTRNYSFSTRDSHSELHSAITLIKEGCLGIFPQSRNILQRGDCRRRIQPYHESRGTGTLP